MELLANAYGLPDDGSVYGILYAWFPADPQSRADKIEQATVQWTQHCSSTALNEGTCEMTLQRVAPPFFHPQPSSALLPRPTIGFVRAGQRQKMYRHRMHQFPTTRNCTY